MYETEYLNRWTTSGIDALIMPTGPWVGYRPETWVKSNAYVGYTSIWNLLGYAALATPVTNVSREKDMPDQEWLGLVPRNAGEQFNKEQCESSSCVIYSGSSVLMPADDINLVEGMPVGVQIVGGRFGEEKCVAVAKAIEQAMRWKDSARSSL